MCVCVCVCVCVWRVGGEYQTVRIVEAIDHEHDGVCVILQHLYCINSELRQQYNTILITE